MMTSHETVTNPTVTSDYFLVLSIFSLSLLWVFFLSLSLLFSYPPPSILSNALVCLETLLFSPALEKIHLLFPSKTRNAPLEGHKRHTHTLSLSLCFPYLPLPPHTHTELLTVIYVSSWRVSLASMLRSVSTKTTQFFFFLFCFLTRHATSFSLSLHPSTLSYGRFGSLISALLKPLL